MQHVLLVQDIFKPIYHSSNMASFIPYSRTTYMDVLQRNRTHTRKICGDGKGGLFVLPKMAHVLFRLKSIPSNRVDWPVTEHLRTKTYHS